MSCWRTAVYSFTGTLTSPKLIDPLQMALGMAWDLLVPPALTLAPLQRTRYVSFARRGPNPDSSARAGAPAPPAAVRLPCSHGRCCPRLLAARTVAVLSL